MSVCLHGRPFCRVTQVENSLKNCLIHESYLQQYHNVKQCHNAKHVFRCEMRYFTEFYGGSSFLTCQETRSFSIDLYYQENK